MRFNRNGVWFNIRHGMDSDRSEQIQLDLYEPIIKIALLALENLKATVPDQDTRYYTDPDKNFTIRSEFGTDEITILIRIVPEEEGRVDEEVVPIPEVLIPFLRVPDAHGILLATGDFNFEPDTYSGVYELWDPYDGQGDIRENYPYAPEFYVLENGEEVYLNRKMKSPYLGFSYPNAVGHLAWVDGEYVGNDIEFKEADRLWGALNQPGCEWYSFLDECRWWDYYGLLTEVESGEYYCTDEANWHSWRSIQIVFLGNAIPGYRGFKTSESVDHYITTQGDRWVIGAYQTATNLKDTWAGIFKYSWVDAYWFWASGQECDGDIGIGTIVYPITSEGSSYTVYVDSFGARQVLEGSMTDGDSGEGYGFIKLYEYGDDLNSRKVFAFNYYSADKANGPRYAGIAENGKVTLTDLRKPLIDQDGNSYTQPWGQNNLGIVGFTNNVPVREIEVEVF